MSTEKYENLHKFSMNVLVNIKLKYRISQASNTTPKQLRWAKGILCPAYKKGDKLDYTHTLEVSAY
jgi:hypothetical protein